MSSISPTILACAVVFVLAGSTAYAADNDLRIVPQISAGTAGVEPGLALEWRGMDRSSLILRPEVFVSEDGRIGAGGAVLYDVSVNLDLPKRQAIAVGPRVVYHNADHYSWEADAMATWGYDLVGGVRAWQHSVGVLGAIGVTHDKEHDDNDLGASAGVFYSYRF
jgi:hypothetical protein